MIVTSKEGSQRAKEGKEANQRNFRIGWHNKSWCQNFNILTMKSTWIPWVIWKETNNFLYLKRINYEKKKKKRVETL